MLTKKSLLLETVIGLLSFSFVLGSFDIKAHEASILALSRSRHFLRQFNENIDRLLKLDEDYLKFKPSGNEFDCKPIDDSVEDRLRADISIDTLKPSDIKVTAAIGDSLTAGLGAKASTVIGLLFEYRGVSFSIGGDANLTTTITMPNILKQFAPDVTGYSTGETWLYTKAGDELNRAVSGSQAHNIMDQVKELIYLLQNSANIDFKNDWKLVTLFIGANDLCETCTGSVDSFPENYINYIREALVLSIEPVHEMNRNPICSELHKFECDCGAYPETKKDEAAIVERFRNYTQLLNDLVASGRYDVTDDFTVVLQPFLANYTVPRDATGEIDLTYFAPDCFHFSSKLHALSSISLWNNMLQPVGQKQDTVYLNKKILCPTPERPYLFTNRNSAKLTP